MQIQVKEGGYDQRVNETVSVVATKTTEIGQKTWGIMKGVMAMASQKVEEYAKEGGTSIWKGDGWHQNESTKNVYYQDSGHGSKGWDSTEDHASKNHNSISSWDDWDNDKDGKEEPSKKGNQGGSYSWAGWDDVKDDDNNGYYDHGPSNKGGSNHRSGSSWGGGGFL